MARVRKGSGEVQRLSLGIREESGSVLLFDSPQPRRLLFIKANQKGSGKRSQVASRCGIGHSGGLNERFSHLSK